MHDCITVETPFPSALATAILHTTSTFFNLYDSLTNNGNNQSKPILLISVTE